MEGIQPLTSDYTTNAFARVLVYYENHRRAKLTAEDLNKIAKKYSTKPALVSLLFLIITKKNNFKLIIYYSSIPPSSLPD